MWFKFALFFVIAAEPLRILGNETDSSLPEAKSVKGFFNFVKGDGTRREPEPKEEDLIEAADYGIEAMNDLYNVKEPKLYSMGIYLSGNNPAKFLAAFSSPSDEARELSRFGYAALEATRKFWTKFPGTALRQTSLGPHFQNTLLSQQCPKRGRPECTPASMRYRTTDGSCNNRRERWWGSSMSSFQRFLPAVYDDGIDSIRRSTTGRLLPSARDVSDHIHEERDAPLVSVSHMLMQWGQFIDHDMTATAQSRAFRNSIPQCCIFGGVGFQPPELMHPDCMPIVVNEQDSHLGRFEVKCLEFVRSAPAPREDCQFGTREQLNQVTSFLDASTVYSSTARQGDTLRMFRNGLMQYGRVESQRPLLPRQHDDSDMCRRGSLSTSCFKAGDGRLSEQPALISLHVVFLRLHNRLATQLAGLNPHWSDEKIFQESRKIVAALVQHVTYREFLPIVLGSEVMRIFGIEPLAEGYYQGYDQTVNPGIANGFASAAFRFGHSLVQQSFVRFDRNHRPIFNNVTIHEEFSNPGNLESAGSVERILLGLVNQPAQKRDVFISDELTNHLFQTPGFEFGMDLAAINIQRGRDHGIPPFVNWREPCVLSPVRTWDDLERIVSSPNVARKFRDVYDTVEDLDLFSAGLAEKPVVGGLVGPTFACIIAQQFSHLRRGDRFWYENPFLDSGFSPAQLEQIRKVTLAQILCKTLEDFESVQPFVMLMADDLRNKRALCEDYNQLDLEPWIQQPRTGKHRIRPSAGNKPMRSKVTQHNRIFVQRPLGPHENLTIVVNNHAVNSPIFVRDSIYGSNFYGTPIPPKPNQDYEEPMPTYGPPATTQDPNNPNPYYRPGQYPGYEQQTGGGYPTTTRRPRPTSPPPGANYQRVAENNVRPSDFYSNFNPNKSNRDSEEPEEKQSPTTKKSVSSSARKPPRRRLRPSNSQKLKTSSIKQKFSHLRESGDVDLPIEDQEEEEEEENDVTTVSSYDTTTVFDDKDVKIMSQFDSEGVMRNDASNELPRPIVFKNN